LTTKRTRTTRLLRSSPVTGPSPLLQGGPPRCPASVLSPSQISCLEFSLYVDRRQHTGRSHRGERFPRFAPAPKPSSRHLCAGQPPGQECRHPPDSSQGNNWTLVPVVVATLTTLPQWFTRIRLLDSHLTHHVRLFRNAHHHDSFTAAACGGLEPPPAWAVLEGPPPSPVQHRIEDPVSYTGTSFSVRGTRSSA
jgi:hypothetical protein